MRLGALNGAGLAACRILEIGFWKGRATVRRVLVAWCLAACVVAALVAPARGQQPSQSTVTWAAKDVLVSDTKAQFDGDQKTIFETSVAIDPNNPRNIIGFAIDLSVQNEDPDLWSVTRRFRSIDGGATWSDLGFMRYTSGRRDITSSGDPVVLFAPDGDAYYASLAHPPGRPDGIYVHRSTNGGATWNVPVVAVAGAEDVENNLCTGTDKEWLEADSNGRLYLAYTLFTYSCEGGATIYDRITDIGVYFTTSADRAKTWSEPQEIWEGYALGAMPRVGPDGTLYIAFWATVATPPTHCPGVIGVAAAKGGGRPFASIVAGSSQDGGETWTFHQQPICDFLVGEVLKPGSFVGGSILPSVSVDDATGVAYIVYPAFLSSGVHFSIGLIKSEDGGESWSAPVEVTPGPADARVPALAADDGVVRLTYVESTGIRDQNDQTRDGATRTLYTESVDGGSTWSEPLPLSSEVGHPTEFTELGDYNTLSVEGKRIAAMWSDARNPEVDGEIWARVGTLKSTTSEPAPASGHVADELGAGGIGGPAAALGGLIPRRSMTHRHVALPSSDLPRAQKCDDRPRVLELTRALMSPKSTSDGWLCSVLSTMKRVGTVAQRLGFRVVFQDYEGFEGELVLAGRDGLVLVRVTREAVNRSVVRLAPLK